MKANKEYLTLSNLSVGYKQGQQEKVVLSEINTSLKAGELVCILGPNGSGKSTLLRTICGLQSPLKGELNIEGENIFELSVLNLARKISVVLTERVFISNLSVNSLVSLGRYPHTGWLGNFTEEDNVAIEVAILNTGLAEYKERQINRLSDGERQKVMIARALAQETPVILLDEPTAYLDLPSKVEIMQLLKKISREQGKAILMSIHDLDLAMEMADKVWLVSDGQLIKGLAEDIVLNGDFEKTFNRNNIRFDSNTGKFRTGHSYKGTVSVAGENPGVFWTEKALDREGFMIDSDSEYKISVNKSENKWRWRVGKKEFDSIEGVMELLKNI